MSMDGAILPINFYCRNARLCLKKAALSKKSHLLADELQHLRAFETLVLSTIPGHPLYPERKEEKPILELHLHLHDAKKRITEIEESKITINRQPSGITNGKGLNNHNSNTTRDSNNPFPTKRTGTQTPGEVQQGQGLEHRENSSFRSQKIAESGSPRVQQQRNSGGSTTPTRIESNPRTRTRSADSTPLRKQESGSPRRRSPRIAADYRASLANSQNKIRRLQHHQRHQRAESSSLNKAAGQENNGTNSKMQDTYAFASKPSPHPRSKSTPILQRLRNVSECLGRESSRRAKEKEKLAAMKVASLSRESSPFRAKSHREMPRLKALGLVSSTGAGKTSSKATIHLPTRYDNCSSPGDHQTGSDDEPEFSNTLSIEDRLIGPDTLQMSSPRREEDDEARNVNSTNMSKGGSFPQRTPPGRYPSHHPLPAEERDRMDQSPESGFGHVGSQDTYTTARAGAGGRLRDTEVQDGESVRRDEAAWTTFRLQEQFGEALKELGSLQDRDGETGASLGLPEKSFRHASPYKLHSSGPSQQQQGYGGSGDKLHSWKLGAHVKGERLHEIEEEEAYFQRRGESEYLGNGDGDSDASGRISPVITSRKKNGKSSEFNISQGKVLSYSEDADNLKLYTAPHSKDGSTDNNSGGGQEDTFRGVREDCERFREKMKAFKDMRIKELSTPPRFHDPGASSGLVHRDCIRSKKGGSREVQSNEIRGAKDFEILSGGGSDVEDDEEHGNNRRHQHVRRREEGQERGGGQSKNNKIKTKNDSAVPISPFSVSSASSSSSSSSSASSSLSSLPLSHYIQKLKHLAPESKFPTSPARGFYPGNTTNATYVASKQQQPRASPLGKHHHHHEPDSSKTLDTADSGGGSDANQGAPPAEILLPNSPPGSHGVLSARIQQRLGHLAKGGRNGSDQRLDAVLGGCALVQSHLHRSQDSSEGRGEGKKRSSSHHHKSQKYITTRGSAGGGGHDLVSYVAQKRGEAKESDMFNGSMASIQRLVGELKGSVEGFKIRIEVESEGWRGRVEGLEKEIETLKDETDEELMELKKSIRNEVKARMSELAADVERIRKEEKDQVETLVQSRIESHLSGSDSVMGDLKKEIRSLWAEVENLTKGREEMRNHMDKLTQSSEESRENTNRELRSLKREVSGADERTDWRKDTEAERTERAEVRHALEKIKDEGLDMKMEVNGLKKAEKVVKSEMENIRKLVEKMQESAEEMERDRGAAQMEGVRERLLIMERVESLSQLYLGGLEEVRTDVYNVKFGCRDRMDELENMFGEYKRQLENGSEDDHTGIQKQRLLNEMDLFRSEIRDMMEIERGLLRESLEREHECTRRQTMDVVNSNKNDLTCMMKIEIQKRIQATKEKVLSVSDPMKKDMDRLRKDMQEAQQGAEVVAHALAMVEKERDLAAQAAAEASAAAEKAGEVIGDLLGPLSQEIATTRRKSLALQDTIFLDRDAASQAFGKAQTLQLEFQEFMEQEKTRLKTAISLVHKERDLAATAASEASTSAVKAGEVLAEVLGSFNQEMSKARRKSYQLQEGLDRERESLERDREDVMQRSQESHEKFNQELERAITTWKRAMNQEVAKAKAITEGLEEDKRRASIGMEQSTGHAMIDHAHFAKTQEVLGNLKTAVKQIQETAEINQEEKQRRRTFKQEERLDKEQNVKVELSSLRQRIDEVIDNEENLRDIVNESGKRIKKLDLLHLDLAQSFQEVKATTSDLEKTAALWMPKYENAARVVNEISSKVENLEERCKGTSADERLMQQMADVAESKVQSLKDTVTAGIEFKDLAQRQALSLLETRVTHLETAIGPEYRELSLNLEYMDKQTGVGVSLPQHVIGLTQTVDNLERKVQTLTTPGQHDQDQERNFDISNKLNGLESRIELVASATFTNLRLLDSKVEECTSNVQQALEGAATAENKCSALGTELVKVFRMLASTRQPSPTSAHLNNTKPTPTCGRDHSPTKTNPDENPSPPRTRSPINNRRLQAPRTSVKGGPPQKSRPGDFARSTMASEMRKVTPRGEVELQEEYPAVDTSSSPARERITSKDHNTQAIMLHQDGGPSDKGGGLEFISERTACVQEGEIKGLGRFTISQDQADDKQKDRTSKCQRTNIRLEAGRIHVNIEECFSQQNALGLEAVLELKSCFLRELGLGCIDRIVTIHWGVRRSFLFSARIHLVSFQTDLCIGEGAFCGSSSLRCSSFCSAFLPTW